MHEVTAQPPVDVDFGAVEHLVRRRRTRTAIGVGGGTALTVALIVGLAATIPGQGSTRTSASAPTSPVTIAGIDSSWGQHTTDGVTWRVPPGWTVADFDHSGQQTIPQPRGLASNVALLSTTKIDAACTDASLTCLQGVPSSGAVVQIVLGGNSGLPDPTANPGVVGKAEPDCSAKGGVQSFNATRTFGTAPNNTTVRLIGCLGKDAGSLPTLLRRVAASVTGQSASRANTAALASGTTAAAPTSWTAGGLSWLTPSGWASTDKHVAPTTVDQVTQINGPYLSTAPVSASCGEVVAGLRCRGGQPIIALGADDAIAQLSVSPYRNIEGDAGQFFPVDNLGQVQPADQDCSAAGGAQLWTWSHLYGRRGNGKLVRATACVGKSAGDERISQLLALTGTISVRGFPDLNAGTDRPTLLPRPTPTGATLTPAAAGGVAAGTTAAALCGSGLGTYETAELTTVGEVRTASWGPPVVDAKGAIEGRLTYAFPGAKTSDRAAWCWTLPAHNIADIYVVHAGDKALLASSINGVEYTPGQVPSGPPAIP